MEIMKMSYSMGLGHEPKDEPDNYGDLHFWLVDKEGNIIDPTPPAFEGKRHYRAFKSGQKGAFNHFWSKLMKNPKQTRKAMMEFLYENPQDRNCPNNCFAYWKKHKDCKIVVGSLGFEIGRGCVFWEFG
jgi:hypothetical protein